MNDLNMRIAKAKGYEIKQAELDGLLLIKDPIGIRDFWKSDKNHSVPFRDNSPRGYEEAFPDYSLIQNAMELMEEIWKEYDGEIHRDCDGYWVVFDLDEVDGSWNQLFHAQTLSEAICLAWLEIFEKEGGQ